MRRLYLIAAAAAFLSLGCSPRVSYSVRPLHVDPKFTGRMLSEVEIALLPVLSSGGRVTSGGELGANESAAVIRKYRPDIKWASSGKFEEGFPARFDRQMLDTFYAGIFRGDMLAVKGMDSVWAYVRQPYILAFSLDDGASIRNMDGSEFRHVSVRGELWDRGGRAVVWRFVCKVVSDDVAVSDERLILGSMRRLTESLPAVMPNYGREKW